MKSSSVVGGICFIPVTSLLLCHSWDWREAKAVLSEIGRLLKFNEEDQRKGRPA